MCACVCVCVRVCVYVFVCVRACVNSRRGWFSVQMFASDPHLCESKSKSQSSSPYVRVFGLRHTSTANCRDCDDDSHEWGYSHTHTHTDHDSHEWGYSHTVTMTCTSGAALLTSLGSRRGTAKARSLQRRATQRKPKVCLCRFVLGQRRSCIQG